MARERSSRAGSMTLVFLSLVICITADLWTVDIDLTPAPAPEDGPPFSAHASRDKALLPFQIVGIVGGYVGSILIIGAFLMTLGRHRRKRALARAAEAKGTEMVKPMSRAFDPSPISPVSSRSWYSPRKLKPKKSTASSIRSGGMSNPVSPAGVSVVSFDAAVVEADKQKRQEEMERLYAVVMAQDEHKARVKATSPPPSASIPSGSPPEYSRRKPPPRLITTAPNLKHLQPGQVQYPTSPCSPSTPKSPIRAIYPPDGPAPPMPSGPSSPLHTEYSSTGMRHMYQPQQEYPSASRERSASEGSRRSSKKFRKSLKNIKISPPIIPTEDNSDGARTPLSPRFYANPGIPPDPPTGRTDGISDSPGYAPTTPGTAQSWRYGDELPPTIDEPEPLTQARALPHTSPQRSNKRAYPPLPACPSPSRRKAETSPISLHAPLPFRQYNNQNASSNNAPTKTTLLETRPRNQFLTAAMGTPRTGLATPYSPYMPFTPLTPVTPRLTSRAERRQREREERTIRGPVVEEDAVKDEGELWGSGY